MTRSWLILCGMFLLIGSVFLADDTSGDRAAGLPSPVSRLYADDKQGDLYVLSIGIEPSLTAKGKNDPYARDAGHISEALSTAEPFYNKVHRVVVNGASATRSNVTAALADLVKAQQSGDLAIVFFSTHGNWTKSEGYSISLAKEGKQWGSLKGPELQRILSTSKGRVIVLLDTCHAEGAIPLDRSRLPQVSFIAACRRDEGSSGSGPSKQTPHGCFVVAVCEALQGKGDTNQDGIVTFSELEKYVPPRAKEQYSEQNAVILHRPGHADLKLAKVDSATKPSSKPAEEAKQTRNPFGMPDVNRPFGKEVAEYARDTRVPGGNKDANAEAWASTSVKSRDSIDGKWSSRWKGDDWSTGSAVVKTSGERVYIMYFDQGGRYLIEARHQGPQRLVGRYVNISDENDTSPWVGRIIDNTRIDGFWPGGRWDLRRSFSETESKKE